MFLYVESYLLISRAGLQVFVLQMLFLCVILHTMWSGKSLQLLCILLFRIWNVVLVCHQYDVCKNSVGSVYVGLSESGLCVIRELCPVSFLLVGESPSGLL